MNFNRRILLHLLFWVLYFSVNLFNEIFLSSSFSTHLSTESLLLSIQAQLLILSVKIPAVYYTLYSLIPRWLRAQKKIKLFAEALIVLFLFLLLYRAIVQLVIWSLVYKEDPGVLTGLELAARFLYSLLDLLQVIGIAAAIKLFLLRMNAIKNEKMLMQEKLQSEMLHLKSQINPHFLFNTLNSIYALARSNSNSTPDAVMRLSKILRYMLYETGKSNTTIEDELKIIDDYVQLQQLRFSKRISVRIEKDIDDAHTTVATLLILPLIENAFKHGANNTTENAEIFLKIKLMQGQLHICVINPIAEPSVREIETEGIGLANISRQLQLLYGKYTFSYKESGNNFIVDLQIDLKSYAGNELFDNRR
jgi:two-component system, LytTR family, sensor kinase